MQQFDRRLIGTWRSDRRRTFQFFKPQPSSTLQRLKKLKALFGKLVVRWGRGKVDTELDGHLDSAKYEILASDSVSIVVRTLNALTGEKMLQQIHFDGDYYSVVTMVGGLTEWFRKVE